MKTQNIVDALILPKIFQLQKNWFCLAFSVMKILPANYIIEQAEKNRELKKGMIVLETSSGTLALGLALVCWLKGYKLYIVGDPAIDLLLRIRLELLGATVVIVKHAKGEGGIQQARMEKIAELQEKLPNYYWPCQYNNINNARSYDIIGQLIDQRIGKCDILVGPTGSGGSLSGTTNSLRSRSYDVSAIAVDTFGSVLFGLKNKKRLLRGLGNSLIPGNLDHKAIDEVNWVTASEAFTATRILYQKHALFMGATSGASFMVSAYYAKTNPDKTVVSIFPDEGYRYQSTVYNKAWLKKNDVYTERIPDLPNLVSNPLDMDKVWSRFLWSRRDRNDFDLIKKEK